MDDQADELEHVVLQTYFIAQLFVVALVPRDADPVEGRVPVALLVLPPAFLAIIVHSVVGQLLGIFCDAGMRAKYQSLGDQQQNDDYLPSFG